MHFIKLIAIMKAKSLTLLFTLLSIAVFGQQWTSITDNKPAAAQATLVSSSESCITVDLQLSGFFTSKVTTPQGEATLVSLPKAISRSEAGEPDLPLVVIPAMIGDKALMDIKIVTAEYVEYENMEIVPSKGDFPRSIDPEDVPYTYGEAYHQNAFFPDQIAKLDEPYIHRDVRGQNMMVHPFAYNPVTKVLRVYNHLVLNMVNIGNDSRNVIESRTKSFKLDPEFKAMYESRYINYTESMAKYTPIEENGELLVICHDAFMTLMEPFVAWKKQIGRPTTMVGTSTTGNNANAIKTYITDYYAAHPNLTDVLLVGDVGQIPGVYISAGAGYNNYSGYGDAQYGQTAGNDYYNELIVGRFCCENVAQVANHVNKVLNYERDLNETDTWLTVGQGVSKNEGAGQGHYGEADYEHIDNIRNDLLAYNYTEVHRDYQGVSGVSSSAATISQHINQGVSIINYCNHGNITLWGVFNYSNSYVNNLTNDNKLPYIISVACLNGKYDHTSSCFAEAWMRATNDANGNPTGAIGGMFSYISQPWTPPQYGQDEMVDILVESYNSNIRRTMGGVSINGNMKVLDQGASQNPVKGTYNTWILFGDPTLTLRNAVPTNMNVSHAPTLSMSATSFTVNAPQGEGALATLTLDGEILGSATVTNGTATIEFTAPGATGEATLTVFGYNKITYIDTIEITSGGSTYPSAPTSLIADAINQDAYLQWGPSTPVDFYKVYRNDVMIAQNITSTNYLDSDLTPGTYTYQVSAVYNGLESPRSNSATVTINEAMSVTATSSANIISLGESCTLTAAVNGSTSGTPSFHWTPESSLNNPNIMSPTATPEVTTTYVVTATLNSITVTDSVTVRVVTPPTSVSAVVRSETDMIIEITWMAPTLATTFDLYRNGELIASDLSRTKYSDEVPGNGSYCYTVTAIYQHIVSPASDEACVEVEGFDCIPPQDFEATTYFEDDVFGTQLVWYKDESVNLTLNRFDIYRGTDPENMVKIAYLVNVPFNYRYQYNDEDVDAGTYYYMITANYGDLGECSTEILMVTVTSVNESTVTSMVYPNPTTGKITIESDEAQEISVFNTLGQAVYQAKLENNSVTLDLSPFGKGVYLLQLRNEKGVTCQRVFVE